MRGTLLVWIGLMGLLGTGGVWLLVGAFPRALAESGPAVVMPWRKAATRAARVRGGILICAGIASVAAAAAGVASFLS